MATKIVQVQRGGMSQFVGEDHISTIRELLQGAERFEAAVAFWGNGAVDALSLSSKQLTGTIVCNLNSQGCNPYEIERLFELKRYKLMNHPGLHAKVYLTDSAACIGSSNASGAGLDFMESSTQREANVLCEKHLFCKRQENGCKKS